MTAWLSQNDTERLGADLAVANSATYVLRRFQDDPIVRALAFKDESELLERIRTVDSEARPKFEDEVEGYAALVAATVGGHLTSLSKYGQRDRGSLRWLNQIIKLATDQASPPRTVRNIGRNDYQFNISAPQVTVVTTSTSTDVRATKKIEAPK